VLVSDFVAGQKWITTVANGTIEKLNSKSNFIARIKIDYNRGVYV